MQREVRQLVRNQNSHCQRILKVVSDNDFTLGETSSVRDDRFKMHSTHIGYILGLLKDIDELVSGSYGDQEVRNFSETMAQGVRKFLQSIRTYTKFNDFTNEQIYITSEAQDNEAKFQTKILSFYNSHNPILNALAFDDMVKSVNIPLKGKSSMIPLLMRETMEAKFPEITQYIAHRRIREKQIKKEDQKELNEYSD